MDELDFRVEILAIPAAVRGYTECVFKTTFELISPIL